MEKLLESKNYPMFNLSNFNRDVKKTKWLEWSMKTYGFRGSTPIEVIRSGDGKFLIRQGHHRFYVARSLGIPIKYVIMDDDITTYQIEKTVVPWSLQDYLDSFCRQGYPEYLKLSAYCEESGISLNYAASMLAGQSAGSGNVARLVKEGTYRVKTGCSHAAIVKDVILFLKKYNIKFYNTALLVQAISKVAWVNEFDIAQMKARIKSFSGILEKKANLDQYLTMVEDLYNRQSHSKIPLKFLAMEAAKSRNAINPTK